MNTLAPFDEILFCEVQITHYQELYRRRCRGWNFKAACFAWQRMKYYQRLLATVNNNVTDLLTEINNTHHEYPAITLQQY